MPNPARRARTLSTCVCCVGGGFRAGLDVFVCKEDKFAIYAAWLVNPARLAQASNATCEMKLGIVLMSLPSTILCWEHA